MPTSNKTLHLIAHNVPYPPDNGGLIDVYYKVKALVEIGVSVVLHAFTYDRPTHPMLEKLCRKVYYYPRSLHWGLLFHFQPFIVAGRRSSLLLERLAADPYPVLCDAIHTTSYLGHPALLEKGMYLRAHNVEHSYYKGLGRASKNPSRKLFYYLEAFKLRRYEKKLIHARGIFAISPGEKSHFEKYAPTWVIPPFHPHNLQIPQVTQPFALFHGNLSVEENQWSVVWLLRKVWERPEVKGIPLWIAGNGSPTWLKRAIRETNSASLLEGLTTKEIMALVARARVHVLPAFQSTGVKLKLIAALAKGLHIVANPNMTKGSGLEEAVNTAETPEDFARLIAEKIDTPQLPNVEVERRLKIFETYLNNHFNAERIKICMELKGNEGE
ncbi:MAG: glycosyltransferase [Flavobacteriales bacterium]|nr:glycosyltransferase [Flavobacteriales bacterium]MCX7768552.1 glycosyltransferase [Flavobacteriales bacterium]MDW8409479.1 glycosyltransferase [Flavobacteriales bacterium]